MGLFPPVKTLIVHPSRWYSKGQAVTIVSGSPFDSINYPASALTDGSGGEACYKQAGGLGAVRINLATGNTVTPNIFGVVGHNFLIGEIVNVQASTSPSMSPLLVNKGFSVRQPGFWIDLRGYAAQADYWQLAYNTARARPLCLGEVVVATGDEYDGEIVDAPQENVQAFEERNELEFGRVIVSASGGIGRSMSLHLRRFLNGAPDPLVDVFESAGSSGDRVIMVPDTHRNDLWLVDWPRTKAFIYPETSQIFEATLTLAEEALGAY